MRVSVFGLGYVGCVTAACLANQGHTVIGVDADPKKVRRLQSGLATVIEPALQERVAAAVGNGALQATTNFAHAVTNTDISLICVGTPSGDNGAVDLRHLETVSHQIGTSLQLKSTRHVVVVRSTAPPGTVENLVIPTIEKSSQRLIGDAFGVCMNPEFMREGSSVADFHAPAFTLIGEYAPRDGDQVAALYSFLTAPLVRTSLKVAESVKLVSNAFHALKVGFANEIGNFCQAFGIDSHEVMDVICRDRILNISPKYLKPGFAFGGSCLPKDLQALLYEAKRRDVDMPIVASILPSNRRQILKALEMIAATGSKRVGIVGLSFKEGTDDLRHSPMVELVEQLIGKGYDLKIYDPVIRLGSLIGANRRYIRHGIPHISSLMTASLPALCRHASVIVLGQALPTGTARLPLRRDHILLDLVRAERPPAFAGSYVGISW